MNSLKPLWIWRLGVKMENYSAKNCHNTTIKKKCSHCGVGCTDDNCDKSVCEIITHLDGTKELTCMCPKSSCICCGRKPDQDALNNHLVEVFMS